MRKQLLPLVVALLLALAACGASGETVTFRATILEIREGEYLVEPAEGSAERSSADRITVPMKNMDPSPEPAVGDVLEIEYGGMIAESYPAQIANVSRIRVAES